MQFYIHVFGPVTVFFIILYEYHQTDLKSLHSTLTTVLLDGLNMLWAYRRLQTYNKPKLPKIQTICSPKENYIA